MRLATIAGRLRNLFLQGIALLAPLVVTIALLILVIRSVEGFVADLLCRLLPADWKAFNNAWQQRPTPRRRPASTATGAVALPRRPNRG